MDNEMGAPERKAEVNDAFADFMGAFEVFKETNDQRLKELEQKSGADVVTVDKLSRVEAALDANQRRVDELVLKSARPSLGGVVRDVVSEKKGAFDAYVRGGSMSGFNSLEAKSLARGEDGLTVPDEIEAEVMRRLTNISPIRSIAGVRQVSSSVFRKPISQSPAATGWVSETAARPETDAPLTELTFQAMELYAMPAATSSLLDDSAVNIEEWLADEIDTAFAEQETKAFVVGDGVTMPQGFANHPSGKGAGRQWNQLERIATGAANSFPAGNPQDVLVDLVYSLKAGYRQNAHFVMNRETQAEIRKMKDVDGNYLWTAPAMPGGRASLMNFAVVEAEDMPKMSSGGAAVAFGDFRRGYLIVDRQGLTVLRDPYSAKPYVLFYTTKRVGGGVQDYEAIKLLRFSAN